MSDYLILVNAARLNGKWEVKLLNYLHPTIPIANPMSVHPGDRIAWRVQVLVGTSAYPLPYHINFVGSDNTPNLSFFGQSALDVPHGGTSPFLHVASLQEKISYSVNVTGVGLIDPEIQTGDGQNPRQDASAGPTAYLLTWDPRGKTISYEGGQPLPDTLPIYVHDTLEFVASNSAPILVTFAFDINRLWFSPFNQSEGTVPVDGPGIQVGPLPVQDSDDPGNPATLFAFTVTDGTNSSNSYTLALSTP